MKITIYNGRIKQTKHINVFFVTDGADKHLVIIDDEEKKKYVPNTHLSTFDEDDVNEVIWSYIRAILQWNNVNTYNAKGRVTKCCHSDDFNTIYKKTYKMYYPCDTELYY